MSQRVVEDPALRHRLGFERVEEGGEQVLRIEMWVDPKGGVPPHIHPRVEEQFHVLSGRPSFLAGREWRTAAPGETVVVPPGTRHAYRNRGEEVAHVMCEARPASRSLEEFLVSVADLARDGKLTHQGLPKTPGAALEAVAIAYRHRDETVLLFPPMPPLWLQRMLFPPLARLAERRAKRAAKSSPVARPEGR
jgi:quercetin dioxygenase-like cupin family protein